mmetsp:Transcript_82297/g.251511  ORF Transcript_82297/g.251511 Transcript_82297/m.251511 type:complete len:309 (-) Transcript_82297:1643-2569(-)
MTGAWVPKSPERGRRCAPPTPGTRARSTTLRRQLLGRLQHAAPLRRIARRFLLLLLERAVDPGLQYVHALLRHRHPLLLGRDAGHDVLDGLALAAIRDLKSHAHPPAVLELADVLQDLLEADVDGCDHLLRHRGVHAHARDLLLFIVALLHQIALLIIGHAREGLAQLQNGNSLGHVIDHADQLLGADPRPPETNVRVDVLQVPRDGHRAPRFAPHLLVDVHDDGQDHVNHQDHHQRHEWEDPRRRGHVVLGRQLLPPELALHGDLETRGQSRLDRGERLQPAPEDHLPSDRERHECGDEHNQEVQQV